MYFCSYWRCVKILATLYLLRISVIISNFLSDYVCYLNKNRLLRALLLCRMFSICTDSLSLQAYYLCVLSEEEGVDACSGCIASWSALWVWTSGAELARLSARRKRNRWTVGVLVLMAWIGLYASRQTNTTSWFTRACLCLCVLTSLVGT